MSALLQTSLWDADEPLLGNLTGIRRTDLGRGAWVDHRPGWLDGAAVLLDRLIEAVPWQEQEREMYGTVVTVPRLVRFYGRSDPLPDPVVEQARETLSEHYEAELGERFVTSGFCLYRDGADSVAWHGDRIGRSRIDDTMIAILSLGSPRTLALRQRGGGPTVARFDLGHGDLAVMGGSCQRTFEHAVPKTRSPVGPRISIQFRVAGVL